MRPIQILETPPMPPQVCIKCGLGNTDREHFVDLGVDSLLLHEENGVQHQTEGVIYFCNMCVTSLIGDYLNKLFEFVNNQRIGVAHREAVEQKSSEFLITEIANLKKKLDAQALQINAYEKELRNVQPDGLGKSNEQKTAEAVLDNLLGSDADGPTGSTESDRPFGENESDSPNGGSESNGTNSTAKPEPEIGTSDVAGIKGGALIDFGKSK